MNCPKCNGSGKFRSFGKCFRCNGTGKLAAPAAPTQLPSMAGVIGLLNRAKSAGLKFPKLWLQLPDGSDLRLTVAGERSKYRGDVMLTDGKPFGANRYFGRISPDGALALAREGYEVKDALVALLAEVASDPVAVAKKYAKLTGACMFCSLRLTDERSTAMGYGPVCAKNWGLPWGEARAEIVALAEEAVALAA